MGQATFWRRRGNHILQGARFRNKVHSGAKNVTHVAIPLIVSQQKVLQKWYFSTFSAYLGLLIHSDDVAIRQSYKRSDAFRKLSKKKRNFMGIFPYSAIGLWVLQWWWWKWPWHCWPWQVLHISGLNQSTSQKVPSFIIFKLNNSSHCSFKSASNQSHLCFIRMTSILYVESCKICFDILGDSLWHPWFLVTKYRTVHCKGSCKSCSFLRICLYN